jgi:peroxiredoxin
MGTANAIGRKLLAWGALALAAGIILIFALPSYRQGEASMAGKPARDFNFDLSGKASRLSDLHGKVVILNFWATWCPPCVEETPALNRLQKYIAPRNGVILGVAADENSSAYDKFLREQSVIFPTYRDPATTDSHSPIAQSYGTSMYPETYIIDRRGNIARKFVGLQQWDSPELLAYFDALLGQP